jgi:hypothetical protein
MKTLIAAVCLAACLAPHIQAQGRGRQGGPGVGGPSGPICLDPADVQSMQSQTTTRNPSEPSTRVITVRGKPGAGQLLRACPTGLGGADALAKHFFAPELIMANQSAIGLTDAQGAAISALVQDAQKNFVPLQFKIAAEVEKLQGMLVDSSVDEARILEAVDRVLAAEREIKREQISLMVRVKNLLTPQQQTALAARRPAD